MKIITKSTIFSKTIKQTKMKKLIIAALALVGFSAASFAQSTPAVKKTEPSKMQVVKKTTGAKTDAKVVALNKGSKPAQVAVAKTAVVKKETKPVAVSKPVVVAKTNAATPLKKDGTPDKRYAENKHLKTDGTKDMRYKANKKHS
jgi:hypothetical protein